MTGTVLATAWTTARSWPNNDQANTDGDAQGNACDSDDDNDGIPDGSDVFPLDRSATLSQTLGVVQARINAQLALPGLSNKAKDKLTKAKKNLDKAISETAAGNVGKGIQEAGKGVAELQKAGEEGAATGVLIDGLLYVTHTEAQAALDAAMAAGGDPHDIAKAQEEMAKAATDLAAGKPDKAIDHYYHAWDDAQKARD